MISYGLMINMGASKGEIIVRVLVLSKKDSKFVKSIRQVFDYLDVVAYKSEHEFPKVMQLIDFVRENNVEHVLMPNPYGNNKRLTCYKKLKEFKISVISSDRGALPDSWFFDTGFNYDSKSFDPSLWDKPLNNIELKKTNDYIEEFFKKSDSLESQGQRIGNNNLRSQLNLQGKKIVFVPLQRPGDTVIRYFAGFSESVENFVRLIHELEKKLNNECDEWVILLKKHPLETSYYETTSKNIYYVADDTNIYDLIELSDVVALINSGVGLTGILYDKKVLCFGNAFYASNGLAISCESVESAFDNIMLNDYRVCPTRKKRFIWHLLDRVYSFGSFETKLVADGGVFRNETEYIDFYSLRVLGKPLIKKRRVLFVSPLMPVPVYRGNQFRINAVLRWLLDNDFSVYLVVLNTSFSKKKSIDLEKELLDEYPSLTGVKVLKDPKFNVGKQRLSFFLSKIKTLLFKKNDICNEIVCPQKLSRAVSSINERDNFQYLYLNYAKTVGVIPKKFVGRVVLDTHDYQTAFLAEDQLVNGANKHINLKKFRKSEHKALSKADTVISINPIESIIFEEILKDANKSIDIKTLTAFGENNFSNVNFISYNYDILYVGSVSNFNVSGLQWFLDLCLPYILKIKPDLKIGVAGNIARTKDIKWELYPNVNLLGVVNDLMPVYLSSKCCIAPILGGAGMKIKVVEALSYAKAIVGTTKAVEGIRYNTVDKSILVADEPKDFAKKVISLIENKELRQQVELRAEKLYQQDHSLKSASDILQKIFN